MVTIDNLLFGYTKNNPLFEDLNLQMTTGLIHGLFGKNGAGKTTLLKLIQGLQFPQKGTLKVLEHVPSQRKQSFLSNSFLLAEEPYIPPCSLKAFISTYSPFYPKFKIEQYFQLLNEFEVDKTMHLGKVSMGQKKKALIAFGIACNTDLLIMDEPTNGLDIPSKKQFRKIMAHIIRDDKVFIISTHQVRDLHSIIDNIIILDHGQVIFDQTVSEVMNHLSFIVTREPPSDDNIIYYERVPGGYLCIENSASLHSLEIDIETLFNAVTTEKESILSLFNQPNPIAC